MTEPLAVVAYEKLLPATQLVNRLQDLKYRVLAVTDPDTLIACCEQQKPLIVLVDLTSSRTDMVKVIHQLRGHGGTKHIPVIAYGPEESPEILETARQANATLVASETAILNQLAQLLDHALQIE
jgi:CheY-like chemotaxis protein